MVPGPPPPPDSHGPPTANPFSTSSGIARFGGGSVWGPPPLALTVRLPLGGQQHSLSLTMRGDATVRQLILELGERLKVETDGLRLFCAGRDLTAQRDSMLKNVAKEGLLHLIAPAGVTPIEQKPAILAAAGSLAASAPLTSGSGALNRPIERSAAVNAAGAAAAARAATASNSAIAPHSGSIKVRFAAREVVIEFDGSMTAKKLKGVCQHSIERPCASNAHSQCYLKGRAFGSHSHSPLCCTLRHVH